jgi:hypothetical protein
LNASLKEMKEGKRALDLPSEAEVRVWDSTGDLR